MTLIKGLIRQLFRRLAGPVNDIPKDMLIGTDLRLPHGGLGVVINKHTTIGDRVTIFQHVTVGRSDAGTVDIGRSRFQRIDIGDDVVIYPGAVVIGGPGVTTIAAGTVIGANAVMIGSTGPGETWVGNPARRVDKPAVETP